MAHRGYDPEKIVLRLVTLAQLMSRGANSRSEGEAFYRLLREIFELPEEQESEVTNWAMGTLLELGDSEAAKFLLDELELDAQLQDLTDERGKTWSCLLFALPVVVPCGDRVERLACSPESIKFMQEVLSDSDVVSQAAAFALVPRVFSHTELLQWSYSGLARLARHLGQQALQGASVAQMPQDAALPVMDAGSCSPYVDLYYVVGVVAVAPSELEDVFPPLGDELAADAGARMEVAFDRDDMPVFALGPSEIAEDGPDNEEQEALNSTQADATYEAWEDVFCEAFDDAFSAVQGALTVLPPDGLLEDLRRGQELAREIGLLRMLDVHCAEMPRVVLGALRDDDSFPEPFVEVSCLAPDGAGVVETVRWPVFAHETDDDALEQLMQCLADARAQVVDERGVPQVVHSSVLLH